MTDLATAAETLAEGRELAEELMVDSCTITRAGDDDTTFDAADGEYVDAADSTVYTGPCQVQVSDGLTARTGEAGGTDLTISRVIVKLPVSAAGVRVDDVVRIDSALNDPELVGAEFTVISEHAKTFATSRRLQVERITT